MKPGTTEFRNALGDALNKFCTTFTKDYLKKHGLKSGGPLEEQTLDVRENDLLILFATLQSTTKDKKKILWGEEVIFNWIEHDEERVERFSRIFEVSPEVARQKLTAIGLYGGVL